MKSLLDSRQQTKECSPFSYFYEIRCASSRQEQIGELLPSRRSLERNFGIGNKKVFNTSEKSYL
jgi:hypothetical protein